MNDNSELLLHSPNPNDPSSDILKKIEKTRKERERKAAKRKRDIDNSTLNHIPFQCDPPKYLFYNPPANTVGHLMVQYFSSLQENDIIARLIGWTDVELEDQMNNSLLLPVFIPPQSQLGQKIASQHSWAGLSLDELFQNIFNGKDLPIPVQDHGLPTLAEFTTIKTTGLVESRFSLELNDRDCPWNCLEVDDRLAGFKGPKLLENGASLLRWQTRNPDISKFVRQTIDPVLGGKYLDQWLLILEKNSGSTAHVDIAVATWVSCLVGKKTFWLRNLSMEDDSVWSEFDVDSDHRLFFQPWAQIDLYPGSILIFSPGTIHSVYTDEDSVFCGGHFLTPGVMDRFVRVLGQTELDPTRTNDLKGVDFFRILENFILETILPNTTMLTKRQLHIFILEFQKYLNFKPLMGKTQVDEQDHLARRIQFVKKAKKEKWIEKLLEKCNKIAW